MNIERLKDLVHQALTYETNELLQFNGEYHSPYYELFALVAKEMIEPDELTLSVVKPICVELGVETGRGSGAMLFGGGRVYGVDNNKAQKDTLKSSTNFTMIIADTLPVPATIAGLTEKISLLHIDTEHSYSMAKAEFEGYRGLLKDGAVVFFDDLNAMEGDVKRYFESLPYEKIIDDRLHPSCGFGVLIYRENA